MIATLLSLFVLFYSSQANSLVCDEQFSRHRADCMLKACPDTGPQMREKDECKRSCTTLAESETKLVSGCSLYQSQANAGQRHEPNHVQGAGPISPQSKRQQQAENPGNSSQAAAHEQVASLASQGEQNVRQEQSTVSGVRDLSTKLQKESLKKNQQLIKDWEKELASGASRDFPPSRSKMENDRKLVQEAERRYAKSEPFPAEKAEQASDPNIRSNLVLQSRGQELETKAGTQFVKLAAALAQLVNAKQAAEKSGTALDSASPLSLFSPSSREAATRAAEPARAPVDANISAKGKLEPGSEREGIIAEKNAGDLPKVPPAAIRASLRERLRELLRKRANGTATPEEIAELTDFDREDMPASFQGDLGQLLVTGDSAESEDPFLAGLSKNVFGMSGPETDATIGRLHQELAQAEQDHQAGVLPAESLTLFQRVKAAHDSCAARKCVAQGPSHSNPFAGEP